MTKLIRFIASVFIAVFAVSALTACAPAAKDMSAYAAVIDVRTAEEWASGHLDGAVNIDIKSASFAAEIDQLDHAANYIVYCRSGNRAGQAIDYMKNAGFTGELINAGSVADASSMTGMKVVQ